MKNFEYQKQSWAWLRSLNLTDREEQYLIRESGNQIENLLDALEQDSIDLSVLKASSKQKIHQNSNQSSFEQANELLAKYRIDIILREEYDFPIRMHHVVPAPEMLFFRGNRSLLSQGKRLGVVGSRRVNDYGLRVTEKLVYEVATAGVHSVSGLAEGIDTATHRASLHAFPQASTIAVLTNGLDCAYPSKNALLFEEIIEKGLVLSEKSPHHEVKRYEIPLRNRLMAALSDVLLLPQAAKKSGTQYTIATGLELGVEVCAVPGPIDSKLSELPNYLIQLGATPILESQNLLDLIGMKEQYNQTKLVKQKIYEKKLVAKENVSQDEWNILSCLEKQAASIDRLALETSLSMPQILICLTKLEQKNMIHKDNACNQFILDVQLR